MVELMLTNHRDQLRSIRTFPSLIKFLREELDWPIESEDFEELTFDYTPEELGIDTANAAKIQEIKRLRPLSVNQPWGIFFVKFEPKRLPVVALRRILSQVALKKRASANSAERAAWAADDLLFVSNYGEGESRQISFAHFSQNEAKKDLPTLKVLGWDNLDTPLHLDHVAELLTERLAWPDDEEDEEDWRRQWRSAFTLGYREVITTSKKLSVELAKLARNIRDRINTILAIETENGPVTKLMGAFKEALVHDLDEDGFADMYAQTIAYGLLSARVANPSGGTADDFASAMPITSPFLKELMETFLDVGGRKGKADSAAGLDFDELGVSEVVELLDAAKMEAVVRDFGDRNPQEDPVIHFYELFLKEYDAKKRMQRGVFYTPRPVVSFIVRSVDELLRTEFGLEDGLADTTTWGKMAERFDDLEIPEGATPDQAFVQILDPATGTGTFLVEVIGLIHKTMMEKWKAEGHGAKKIEQLWNDYVPKDLLPRLHGYELMMAPYAIAHMKIGLKLYETGYRFGSDERARIYLTNALEPAQDFSGTLAFAIPALAHEAQAVNEIKRRQRFTVVTGNPPYSLISANMEPEHRALVDKYKYVGADRIQERGALQLEKILNDDYVKFIAKSESSLDATGVGILGLITNHAYLDNPTMRGLRYSLLASFNRGFFYNLGGSAKKSRGEADQNVFDIQQGVAVCIVIKQPHWSEQVISYSRLSGDRKSKYALLGVSSAGNTNWLNLHPGPPHYLLIPTDYRLSNEYDQFVPLLTIFQLRSIGCFTSKDHFVISREPDVLVENAKAFRDSRRSDKELCKQFEINPKAAWDVGKSRKQLQQLTDAKIRTNIQRFTHRPFDSKYIFYHRSLVWSLAYPVNRNLIQGQNLALVTSRQLASPPWAHLFCSDTIVEMFLMSNKTKEGNHVFPLWLVPDNEVRQMSLGDGSRRPNLHSEFLNMLSTQLGIPCNETGLPQGLSPEDIFQCVYAVFSSPTYRSRYAEFLKIDFPRLPVPSSLKLFHDLARLGGELVALHLMESPKLENFINSYTGQRNPEVGRVGWSGGTVWLDAGKTNAREGHRASKLGTIGFKGVPEEVWDFHIGGYQVCHKWLKDRKGRTLSDGDIAHYQKIVVALAETIRLMKEIDEVIEQHGGWPGAFATGQQAEQ